MMKLISFIFILLPAICFFGSNNGGEVNIKKWLVYINDTIPVSRLSLPGAHDAATGNGLLPAFAPGVTQCMSISELWDCGIRVFDFRPALDGSTLNIYHGPLKTKVSFAQAVDTILQKISSGGKMAHEFAIVLMRNEKENDNVSENMRWAEAMGEYIASLGDRAAIFDPGVTVGELRGKILFLSRSRYSGCNKGAGIEGWNHSPKGNFSAKISSYGNDKTARLMIQDFYAPTNEKKQSAKINGIMTLLDSAANSSCGTWSINHVSGFASTYLGINGLASDKGYRRNAAITHPAALLYIKGDSVQQRIKPVGPTGIIMMDYAGAAYLKGYHIMGDSLVAAIIANNFAEFEIRINK